MWKERRSECRGERRSSYRGISNAAMCVARRSTVHCWPWTSTSRGSTPHRQTLPLMTSNLCPLRPLFGANSDHYTKLKAVVIDSITFYLKLWFINKSKFYLSILPYVTLLIVYTLTFLCNKSLSSHYLSIWQLINVILTFWHFSILTTKEIER